MTIDFCEVGLAVILCSVITVLLYMASWYKHEENQDEDERAKQPSSSNMQGLENDQPVLPRHRSEGQTIKESSDLSRIQDEDLRSRVADHSLADDYVNIEYPTKPTEYDPVVHPDGKQGRVHLSIRHDGERRKLVVQIVDGQGLIHPEQTYAPEMTLAFSLIGPFNDDETEKHTRVVVANDAVKWKEPMEFSISRENAIRQNLYVSVANETDPHAPRDREVSVSLEKLAVHDQSISQWFDLNDVQSSY